MALQETGGRPEITALAAKAKLDWLWTRGKDTATGEEVGLLYRLPGWKVAPHGRVAALDKAVRKHLLVSATKAEAKVYFLVVHLLRPIGAQAEKHQRQLAAIGEWMRGVTAQEPKTTVVVLGDTNNSDVKASAPLYGLGTEAGALNQLAATGDPPQQQVLRPPGRHRSRAMDRHRPPSSGIPRETKR